MKPKQKVSELEKLAQEFDKMANSDRAIWLACKSDSHYDSSAQWEESARLAREADRKRGKK